jgi:hypothetical protein
MILNYFPHDVWQDVHISDLPAGLAKQAQEMSSVRQKFYYPIVRTLDSQWSELNHDQFVAVVQGITLTGPDVLREETVNNMVNSFSARIDLLKGKAMNFEQVI